MVFGKLKEMFSISKQPEGFDVTVTREERINDPEKMPEQVKKFMWGMVSDPTDVRPVDAKAFSFVKAYVRNDRLVTYTAVSEKRNDLGIPGPVLLCIDHDPAQDDVVGEAMAEVTDPEDRVPASLRIFDTYSLKRGHHLSYARLRIFNKYSFETDGRTIDSGYFATHTKSAGGRARELYAGADKVWKPLQAHLDATNDKFAIIYKDQRYVFVLRSEMKS